MLFYLLLYFSKDSAKDISRWLILLFMLICLLRITNKYYSASERYNNQSLVIKYLVLKPALRIASFPRSSPLPTLTSLLFCNFELKPPKITLALTSFKFEIFYCTRTTSLCFSCSPKNLFSEKTISKSILLLKTMILLEVAKNPRIILMVSWWIWKRDWWSSWSLRF